MKPPHFLHYIRRSLGEGGHLAPTGLARFVLANGSMSSNQSGEGNNRQVIIEADREMPSGELRFPNRTSVTSTFALRPSNFAPALPGQLFSSTQIPVCLWFLAKNKHDASVVENKLALAIMNLALRGIEADFGPEHADTFRRDLSIAFQAPTRFLKAA